MTVDNRAYVDTAFLLKINDIITQRISAHFIRKTLYIF